jgi:predicted DNA-binding WGR domain protein
MTEPYPTEQLELRACDESRNLRRRYVVQISRDLFGTFLVETSWGRIGSNGRSKREVFDTQAAAEASARAHVRRRASAVRRIGVPYLPVSAVTPNWAAPYRGRT